MRIKSNFDRDWRFSLSDDSDASDCLFDDSCWEMVQLPHDFSVGHAYEAHASSGRLGGFVKTGVGLYRKVFLVTPEMLQKRVFLEFDGVYMNAKVYVNGVQVGHRPYGYSSFGMDITAQLHTGENLIFVRADCEQQAQGRWYTGCGIYRHVWLTVTEKVYVAHWGSFIKATNVTNEMAQLDYQLELQNETETAQIITLSSTIYDANKQVIATEITQSTLPVGLTTLSKQFTVQTPCLWYPEQPTLYSVVTEIRDHTQQVLDQYETTFGIRTMEFRANEGFFLNDTHYNFKGVCIHHDGGVVGAAVPRTIWKKRIALLKEMGCNAIRTSHNPFAPEFYDLCDEMGMFVMDEIFDGWEIKKAPHDYGLYFNEWHTKDCVDFIKRDRNHACVVIWSIGNEVLEMDTNLTKELQDLFHSYDDTRLVTCGVQAKTQISEDNRAILDVAGYNDGGGACFAYERDHKRRPNQLMIATEAPHTMQTRGFYRTLTWWRDKNQPRMEIANLTEQEVFTDGHIKYASSYDNHGVRVCARDSYSLVERLPYLCGEFRWTGFDYVGETFGWPGIKSDNGVMDCANFKKDHFFLYQSMWCDANVTPMVHLLPHWTHPTVALGTVIPVWIYTNCEEVELFLNGKSLGKQTKGKQKNLSFDVPYEYGELKAIAFIHGKEICQDVQRTASHASQIHLSCDDHATFNGEDTVQIDCSLEDTNGVLVPYANNKISFLVEGAARFVGTENGDIIDHTVATSPMRNAFNGLCAATVAFADCKGDVCVTAAGILGDKIFKETTTVSFSIAPLALVGASGHHDYAFYYGFHSPSAPKVRYDTPFTLTETTTIYADVYRNGKKLFSINERFTKGEKAPVIDLEHLNYAPDLQQPVGPFSEKLLGTWNDSGFAVTFAEGGILIRHLTEDTVQPLGYWWYDFPVDAFEAQDYAGTGEMWLATGEKVPFKLLTQEGKTLEIDNANAAFRTQFGFKKTITMTKE